MLGLGLAASLIFQGLLNKERWSNFARYTWASADIFLYTTLVIFAEGQGGPMVAGYFFLIAASGLWFRERLVWFTTGLSAGANLLLTVIEIAHAGPSDAIRSNTLVLIGLIVTGVTIGYQVRRVRALSRFYEHRPLP